MDTEGFERVRLDKNLEAYKTKKDWATVFIMLNKKPEEKDVMRVINAVEQVLKSFKKSGDHDYIYAGLNFEPFMLVSYKRKPKDHVKDRKNIKYLVEFRCKNGKVRVSELKVYDLTPKKVEELLKLVKAPKLAYKFAKVYSAFRNATKNVKDKVLMLAVSLDENKTEDEFTIEVMLTIHPGRIGGNTIFNVGYDRRTDKIIVVHDIKPVKLDEKLISIVKKHIKNAMILERDEFWV